MHIPKFVLAALAVGLPVALQAETSSAQQFSSVAECKSRLNELDANISESNKENSLCIRSSFIQIDYGEECAYNNSGPDIRTVKRAYPMCGQYEVQSCQYDIERSEVRKICNQMAIDLAKRAPILGEDGDNLKRAFSFSLNNAKKTTELEYAANRYSAAGQNPKVLLLGTYFDPDVIDAAGGSSSEGSGFQRMSQIIAKTPISNAYEALLGAVRNGAPVGVRTKIDTALTEMMPSYKHNEELSTDDWKKFEDIIGVVQRPFLSKNKGIAAIQKAALKSIIDQHKELMENAEKAWNSFDNQLDANISAEREMWASISAYEVNLDAARQQRSNSSPSYSESESSDPCVTDGGFNICGAIAGVLGAVISANQNQGASSGGSYQRPSGGGRGRCVDIAGPDYDISGC